MARLYCSKEDVKKYLPPNIVVEGDNPSPSYRNPTPESVFNIDLDYFCKLYTKSKSKAFSLVELSLHLVRLADWVKPGL